MAQNRDIGPKRDVKGATVPKTELFDPSGTYRRAHAVVIGIDQYDDVLIPNLHFARADAEAIHAALVDPEVGRFHPDNVTLLVDQGATRKAILSAIGTRLPRHAQPEDTVVIYFAGHGAPEIDKRPRKSSDGMRKFLIPRDAEIDDLFATAIPMDVVQEMFARIDSRSLVFFLDACYSGNAGGRTFVRPGASTRAAGLTYDFLEELSGKGKCVITSCDESEVSIEPNDLGHGLFTHFLVQGMRGAADKNGSGAVDLDELYDYVCDKVSRESRAREARMTPVRKGEMRGRVPLAFVDTPKMKRARELRRDAAAAQERGDIQAAESLTREAAALDPPEKSEPPANASSGYADRPRARLLGPLPWELVAVVTTAVTTASVVWNTDGTPAGDYLDKVIGVGAILLLVALGRHIWLTWLTWRAKRARARAGTSH
jgi:uncharacterized caspase-like protein